MASVEIGAADAAAQNVEQQLALARGRVVELCDAELRLLANDRLHDTGSAAGTMARRKSLIADPLTFGSAARWTPIPRLRPTSAVASTSGSMPRSSLRASVKISAAPARRRP